MHSIGSQLKAWRKATGLQQDEAAAHLELSPSTYQNYERDTRAPNTAGWVAFARAGINTNWLLTNEGEMLLQARPGGASDAPYAMHQSMVLEQRQETAGYIALPLYNDVRAAAGNGAINGTEHADDALMFKEDWIRLELGARPQDLCLIRVSGDSMEPTLRAGDVILVDHRACRPDREGIYILRLDEMLLVKRVQALPGGVIKVSSDNAAFDSWTLKLADIDTNVAIIGRVVWSGRRL